MSFKDCLGDDVDKVFLNDEEFALEQTQVTVNGTPAKGIFDLAQDLVQVGDNFYRTATLQISNAVVIGQRYQDVIVKGETWKIHQILTSDCYMTIYLLRNKEAHRFD